ncbi:antitoxin [Deinococcus radiopugnans]|uniref:AbrB/MazE/SpoVT family DNA-binding domain-containing protein n=1 Tax=Deinococcus radiopugnans ATCC 19172 TaxID=585398 RepID=A0A5C4Y482_9DEIO|nr:type II toxin-antitoxin system VapB family antitoxin [Deinococcus radiopugnans]MBB6017109.1 antitoxin VapB [Deinococcus radiopugnans ATCC 19172]TNM70662.1 AbrB/MazE/SpoVT family DNA-binding domain-containing protein [Deinococcus radiopugnans ATCC 19172]
MTTAKVFQSGNSQAVRLPREMRLDVSEVEVTRHGDLLILRPLRPEATLASAFDALAGIGDDFLPEGRQQGETQERETL